MPYYDCTFIDERGRTSKRVLPAASRKELMKIPGTENERLIRARRRLGAVSWFSRWEKKRSIGNNDFLLVNQQLIALLKSGLSFLRALESIIENTPKLHIRETLSEAAERIRNGEPLSKAFSNRPLPYYNIYQASLLAGESSGQLETVLERFNLYLGKITRLRRKLFSSLSYPAVLLIFMTAMIIIVLVFVIPKFSAFFTDMDATLPFFTILFTSIGETLQRHLLLFSSLLAASYIFLQWLVKKNPDFTLLPRTWLKIPFTGRLILDNALVIFTRTLSILLMGGLPVPEAGAVAVGTFNNQHLRQSFQDLPERIRGGRQLSQVLSEIREVPGLMIEMIKVGETSGNLTRSLDEIAEYLENTIDTRINTLISLIEPIIIIIMGLVIAFMLVSVYLPIFSIIRVV